MAQRHPYRRSAAGVEQADDRAGGEDALSGTPTSSSRQGRASSIQLSADWRYSRPSARPWPTTAPARRSARDRSRRLLGRSVAGCRSRGQPCRALADQRDHVGNALGAVGRQLRVRLNGSSAPAMSVAATSAGGPVLHRRQDQRDDALGDRGIAVGEEMQAAVGQRGSDRPRPTPSSRGPWSRRS